MKTESYIVEVHLYNALFYSSSVINIFALYERSAHEEAMKCLLGYFIFQCSEMQ